MKVWYKTSSHQMDDPEMEYLQSVDCAACAVWEWLKGQCKQRDDCKIPEIGKVELKMVCRRLGVDIKRMEKIISEMADIGWVVKAEGCFVEIGKWDTWQTNFRSSHSDAKRKRDGYWRKKVEGGKMKLAVPDCLHDAEFLKEWKLWISYRRSHQASIADEVVFFQKQLNWLANYGPRKATNILDITMRNSWQGLDAAAKNLES